MKKLIIYSALLLISNISFGQTNTTLHLQNMQKIYDDYNAAAGIEPFGDHCELEFFEFTDFVGDQDVKVSYLYEASDLWYCEKTEKKISSTSYSIESSRIRTFDTDGRPQMITTYDGDASADAEETERIIYTYDGPGQLLEYTISVYENEVWFPHRKRLYGTGGLNVFADLRWDDVTADWVSFQFTSFTGTADTGLLIDQVIFLDTTYSEVDYNYKYIYEFVEDTNLIESISIFAYDSVALKYGLPLFKNFYHYPNQQLSQLESMIYNETTGEWENIRESYFTYNQDATNPVASEFIFVHAVFHGINNRRYYCPALPVAIDEITENTIQLSYSNPMYTNTDIYISGITAPTQLYIHAMDGRTILAKEIENNSTIQLPIGLPKGMYVINLLDNNQSVITEKFIKH